jgi:Skp family chaperone for outer membrane proteins
MLRFERFDGFNGRTCVVILASALVFFAPAAGARQSSQGQQAPPLGTVAKQLRAEKQPASAGKKVWTNDNLPTNPFAISIVGPPLPEEKPVSDESKAEDKSKTAPKETTKTLAEMEAELKKAQEALALHEQQFDLSKRDAALQQQAFYADPRANQDDAGQAQLAEVQRHLDALQQDLEKERVRVAELQAKLDEQKKSAVPTSPGEGTDTSGEIV